MAKKSKLVLIYEPSVTKLNLMNFNAVNPTNPALFPQTTCSDLLYSCIFGGTVESQLF